MTEYIATFYSHFGTIVCCKACEKRGWRAQALPVPRALSSSCGTCVCYNSPNEEIYPTKSYPEELEQIVLCDGAEYRQIYRAENS